jgi:hypothetical protein
MRIHKLGKYKDEYNDCKKSECKDKRNNGK